jgi:hypothetical protein
MFKHPSCCAGCGYEKRACKTFALLKYLYVTRAIYGVNDFYSVTANARFLNFGGSYLLQQTFEFNDKKIHVLSSLREETSVVVC